MTPNLSALQNFDRKIMLEIMLALVFSAALLNSKYLAIAVVGSALVAFSLLTPRGLFSYFILMLPVMVLTDFARFNHLNTLLLVGFTLICLVRTKPAQLLQLLLASRHLLIFMATTLLTLFFSTNRALSFQTFLLLYLLMLGYYLGGIKLLAQPGLRQRFEAGMAALLLAVFAHSLLQWWSRSFGLFVEYRDKLSLIEMSSFNSIKYPSFLAASYVASEFYFLLLPFVMLKVLCCTGTRKLVASLLALCTVSGVLLTQQRSGLAISIVVIVGCYLLANFEFKAKKIIQSFLFVLLLIVALTFLSANTETGRELTLRIMSTVQGVVAARPDTIDDSGSAFYRVLRVVVGWRVFLEYPLFGSGLGTSAEVYPDFGWTITDYTGGAHNLLVFLLAETGIVGCAGFLIFYLKLCRETLLRYRNAADPAQKKTFAAFVMFLLAVLLDGLFSGLLVLPSIVFIFTGLAYIASYNSLCPGPRSAAHDC